MFSAVLPDSLQLWDCWPRRELCPLSQKIIAGSVRPLMQLERGWLQKQSYLSSSLPCTETCIVPAGEAARATHHGEVPRLTHIGLGILRGPASLSPLAVT